MYSLRINCRSAVACVLALLLFLMALQSLAVSWQLPPRIAGSGSASPLFTAQLEDVNYPRGNPLEYWKWFYSQRAFPGSIPGEAYLKALSHVRQLQEAPQNPALPSGTWASVGPAPITGCGAGSANQCSGRISAIAVDPSNPTTIYVGGAQGGVWKSTNGGASWIVLYNNQPSLAVGSIAVDASGKIYVGTGEGNASCDSYYGAGILKSTDGGTTWTQIGASTFSSASISKIAIKPDNAMVIIAMSRAGLISSSTEQCTFVIPAAGSRGVLRSTDGGTTWTNVVSALRGYDVVFDPTSPTTVYAAVAVSSGTMGQIYKSTDGGATWGALTGGGFPPSNVGRIALAISGSTLLAAIEVTNTAAGALYRTTDGGTTWTSVSVPLGPFGNTFCSSGLGSGQCWYDLVVAMDPANANNIFLGGYDLHRSTNGGTTWADLGGYTGNIHPDQHAFAFSPSASSTIYAGNDGGVWSSSNGLACSPSSCWTNLNLGLEITQFQFLAAHPTNPQIFFGGTQDNGSPERTGASSVWTMLIGGDGGWTAFDKNNPSTMYHTFFGISPQRSDDGGVTWTTITTGITTSDAAQFYIPMAMDPTTPATLYLGTFRLYKTTNKGNIWYLPAPGLSLTGGAAISAIAVAPSNGLYVYVGATNGKFFTSTDGGVNFVERDTGLPTRFVTKIAVDPSNPQKVYATFSGFGGGHLFYSANAGTSWSDISSNLPDIPANAVAVDSAGGIIYVGTDVGVFASDNNGASWSVLGTGLPNVTVFDLLFAANGQLLAATHGRSVWRFTVSAAAFDFSLSNSGPIAVAQGSSGSNTITATLVSGSTQLVSLACTSGLPTGASCMFNPGSGSPTFNSILTVSTSLSTATGSYPVTVTGTGGAVTRTTQFTLMVNPVALSSVGPSILNAAANNVYYIYPATAQTGGTKAPGVIYASAADWSATGLILGLSANTQNIGLDSNNQLCSSSNGQPLPGVIGTSKGVVIASGPIVHSCLHYYELVGGGADKAPVFFAFDGTNYYFKRSGDNAVLATMPQNVAGQGADLFLIEVFVDANGRIILALYGFTYLGTLAATTYFKFFITPNLSTYTKSYYILQWNDAASGLSHNGIPDPGDVYTLVTSATPPSVASGGGASSQSMPIPTPTTSLAVESITQPVTRKSRK